MQLSGNTVFITGATSGIGRGLAEALHARGNHVIISGRRKALLDEVTAANPGMAALELDIADSASVAKVARHLIETYPKLNVLINNAGVMPFHDASTALDEASVRSVIDTNLLGPIMMTSALVEHLKSQESAVIIHNTSVLAFVPLAGNSVYSSTKAALHSYAMSQRFALRDSRVQVVEISPPWVDTDLVHKSGDARAMPLDAYVTETLAGLASGGDEVFVEGIRPLRDNPGSGEYELVNAFNLQMVANPIPVG